MCDSVVTKLASELPKRLNFQYNSIWHISCKIIEDYETSSNRNLYQ